MYSRGVERNFSKVVVLNRIFQKVSFCTDLSPLIFCINVRVAKFDSKVGSRRTTKI